MAPSDSDLEKKQTQAEKQKNSIFITFWKHPKKKKKTDSEKANTEN